MWRLEKDPHLSSTFGTVSMLDRAPDFDALRAPDGASRRPRSRGCGSGCSRPRSTCRAPTVGRRPRLRHRRTTSAASPCPKPGIDAPAARPRDADHRRPVRPHPAAVAVRRHRGPARRQGGADPEDAPHDHRRRGRRADVAAVPRLRSRRPEPPPIDPTHGRRSPATEPARSARRHDARLRRRQASACRSASPSRCATCSPTRRASRTRRSAAADTFRGIVSPALRHRAGPLAAVDRALAAPPLRDRRGRRSATPRTPPSGSAARSTRRSSPPPPKPPPATTSTSARPVESLRASMAISTRTELRTPTRSRSPG